ncbi:hypothetical protein Hdeb2414_s0023g00643281 [Helianthus debilis subsp. tardiflorus]
MQVLVKNRKINKAADRPDRRTECPNRRLRWAGRSLRRVGPKFCFFVVLFILSFRVRSNGSLRLEN